MTRPAPPQLLVSVRNCAEALAAFSGGANWIDLKEPLRGPLGPVDADQAWEVAETLSAAASLSAAGGELRDWRLSDRSALLAIDRVEVLKLGTAGAADGFDPAEFEDAALEIAAVGKRLALAAYADAQHADAPPLEAVFEMAVHVSAPWLVVDTFDKRAAGLLHWVSPAKLANLAAACHAHGMRLVVAGRLTSDDFGSLPLADVDVIGVRSAACAAADRMAEIDALAVESLKDALAAAVHASKG